MTKHEWLVSNDPQKMLAFLWEEASDRKLRLFAVACCRRIWHLFRDERSRDVVEVAECFADGLASEVELEAAGEKADAAILETADVDFTDFRKIALVGSSTAAAFAVSGNVGSPLISEAISAAEWAVYAVTGSSPLDNPEDEAKRLAKFSDEVRSQTHILRDIFANPFRSVALDPAWPTWHGGSIPQLAQAIYDDRDLPSGHLDHHRLAVLADALEDAGCTDPEILGHCRGPGPHVRGCWLIDLLLGKE
jgi:hypothetical protein